MDRIAKVFILSRYAEGEGFPVWPGVFHLTRVNNTGAAFGILKGAAPLLIAISIVSVLILSAYLFRELFAKNCKTHSPGLSHYAWALVIGGALGNLYDRLRYGYVVDFLDFRVWPVFNIADSAICVGVFFIFLGFLKANPCTRSSFK